MSFTGHKWPRDLDTRLIDLAKAGLSGTQCADILNYEFDYDLSRSAICGRIWRIRNSGIDQQLRLKGKFNGHIIRPVQRVRVRKPIERLINNRGIASCEAPVHILDFEGGCRWPLWADKSNFSEKFYCANAVEQDCVYCAAHSKLAYGYRSEKSAAPSQNDRQWYKRAAGRAIASKLGLVPKKVAGWHPIKKHANELSRKHRN